MHNPPRSSLIRVQSNINDETRAYFNEFTDKLNELEANIPHKELVNSEDAFKLTLVRFDDIIKSEDFEIWQRCKDAYERIRIDPTVDVPPSELHIYPAEINACNYESLISETLNKNYHILHPDVVALLGDDQRIEMFFRALAFGFIKKEEDLDGGTFWTYQIPGEQQIVLSESIMSFGVKDRKKRESEEYFMLINQFVVKAEDIRVGRSKNWIDFERLNQEILSERKKLGTPDVKTLYKDYITKSDGMVQEVRNYVKRERTKIKDPNLRASVARDHEDLADLSETIYLIAAE